MAKLLWSNEELEQEEVEEFTEVDVEELGYHIRGYVQNYDGHEDYVLIRATKVDWRGRSGYKQVSLWDKSDLQLGRDILPDYDSTFRLYLSEDNELYAVVSSHDIPTGATWQFTPMKDVESVLHDMLEQSKSEELGYFEELLGRDLGIDVSLWAHEDITEHYITDNLEGVSKVLSLGDSTFVVFLDEDNTITDIDYEEDIIEDIYRSTL